MLIAGNLFSAVRIGVGFVQTQIYISTGIGLAAGTDSVQTGKAWVKVAMIQKYMK